MIARHEIERAAYGLSIAAMKLVEVAEMLEKTAAALHLAASVTPTSLSGPRPDADGE